MLKYQTELRAANGTWNHLIFSVFFLAKKLYVLTDNLSKRLQRMKMPTVDISSDRDFDLFYELISKKAPAISDTGEPGLPKK